MSSIRQVAAGPGGRIEPVAQRSLGLAVMKHGLLVGLLGCHRVFGVEPQPDAAVIDGGPDAPPPACLYDSFDFDELAAATWTLLEPSNAPISIVVRDMQLVISLPPMSGQTYRANAIASTRVYDATDGAATVRVVKPVSFTGGAESFLSLVAGPDDAYAISAGGQGTINFQVRSHGVRDTITRAWQGNELFWRLRHHASAATVTFETSADGGQWVVEREVAASVPVSSVQLVIGAGTFQDTSSPGTAVFDDAALDTARCSQVR